MEKNLYISPLTQLLLVSGKGMLCGSNTPADVISIGGTGNPAHGR